jgi:hypothetical protein
MGKIPPSLVWLGVLIAIALLVSVILHFRLDKRAFRNSSGNLAKLAAILRASSLVSSFAADLLPCSSSK